MRVNPYSVHARPLVQQELSCACATKAQRGAEALHAAMLHNRWGQTPRSLRAGGGFNPPNCCAQEAWWGASWEKAGREPSQVRAVESNASEPL